MHEEEILRMYEQIRRPEPPFTIVGTYDIPYNNRSQRNFSTLVSADLVIAYQQNDEDIRVNPLYRDSEFRIPVTIVDMSELDVLKMLATVVSSITKKQQPLEKIIFKYGSTYQQMLQGLQDFRNQFMH